MAKRIRKIEEPEDRVAEDLERTNKKYNRNSRLKETSVTATTYHRSMVLLKLFIGVVVLTVIAAAIWYGVSLFTSK